MKMETHGTASLFPDLLEEFGNPWSTAAPASVGVSYGGGVTALEICAGAGGQSIGLEQAGFQHVALIEVDRHACATLRLNRPGWNVIEQDVNSFDGSPFKGVDVIAGGLPCPPFSVAGKQLGKDDERNLFPAMIRLVDQIRPRAVMIENVRGFLAPVFDEYRTHIKAALAGLGYEAGWKLMNASDFEVPQLRPRVVLVAIRRDMAGRFAWPKPSKTRAGTVGEVLFDLMGARGWAGVKAWAEQAREIAPTIVGGSHKHGGPDLGPTRARKAWAALRVNGVSLADDAPPPDFPMLGMPRLTIRMVARIQGFPDEWQFAGTKTHAYRQVGNAFPPPYARAVGGNLMACVTAQRTVRSAG